MATLIPYVEIVADTPAEYDAFKLWLVSVDYAGRTMITDDPVARRIVLSEPTQTRTDWIVK